MNRRRLLLAVTAWGGLFTAVNPACAQTWTLTSAPISSPIACSADGSKLVAISGEGSIYTSTNSGASWISTSAPLTNWTGVACAADGAKLAAAFGGSIYTSIDSGATWTPTGAFEGYWSGVASSADGNKLAVVTSFNSPPPDGSIHVSTNAGVSWARSEVTIAGGIPSIAGSSDGSTIVVVWYYPGPGSFLSGTTISTNWGATWSRYLPSLPWTCVASSADGSRLVAAATSHHGGDSIYISTNLGTTWMATSAPNWMWSSLASSADGSKLVAAQGGYPGFDGTIYTSADFGANWTSNNAPITYWFSVASSADGCKLFASGSGGLYTWQTTPHPVLSVRPSGTNLVLSWIIPSQPFVLQENADLTTTNWTDVAGAPVLNLTNLQNQVTLPLPAANRFYRLKHS